MSDYTGTYIDSANVLDDDVRSIANKQTAFFTQAEAWFTSLCEQYSVTAPTKVNVTYYQMRAIVLKLSIIVCQSKAGQTANQLQDGLLDKYERKLQIYSREFYGSNNETKANGIHDLMLEELTRGTDQMQYEADWSY